MTMNPKTILHAIIGAVLVYAILGFLLWLVWSP